MSLPDRSNHLWCLEGRHGCGQHLLWPEHSQGWDYSSWWCKSVSSVRYFALNHKVTGKNCKSITIILIATQQSWKEMWVWGWSASYPIWEDSLVNCPIIDFEPISYLTQGLFLGFSCISFFELIYWTSTGILRTFIWRHPWVLLCKALFAFFAENKQDHLRMNVAQDFNNHLRSIDLFRSMIIKKDRSKVRYSHWITIG